MRYVVTNSVQTIWDIAYQEYGNYNAVKQLLIDNPGNLNLNDPVPAGILVKITSFEVPYIELATEKQAQTFLRFYITTEFNQNIWDIAIKWYGTYNAVGQLIQDNPGKLNFNDDITPGTRILISQSPILKQMVDYLISKGITPTTAVNNVSNWILAQGKWNDAGSWIDTDQWID